MFGKTMRNQPSIPTVARLAPLVGFMGTIVGQTRVFMHIEAPGPVSPLVLMTDVIAGLLTTVALIVLILVPTAVWTYVRTGRR